jgi:hypothetical protein
MMDKSIRIPCVQPPKNIHEAVYLINNSQRILQASYARNSHEIAICSEIAGAAGIPSYQNGAWNVKLDWVRPEDNWKVAFRSSIIL